MDLKAYLKSDDLNPVMLDLERSYNFLEGKYIMNHPKSDGEL